MNIIKYTINFFVIITISSLLFQKCSCPYNYTFGNVNYKPTFECLGLYVTLLPIGSSEIECKVQYRRTVDSTWKDALSLWYDKNNNEYRGSIVNLSPGTTYEVLITPLGTGINTTITASTWSETFPIASTTYVDQNSTLEINESGSESGYRLYTFEDSGDGIDGAVNNLDHCITINAHHVIIRGLTLTGARLHIIRLYDVHDIVIENCDMSNWGTLRENGWGNDYQSCVYWNDWGDNGYACERIIIQNNKMHDPRYDTNSWIEDGHPEGPQAITFMDSDGNHVFRYNEVYSTNGNYFNDGFGGTDNFGLKGFPNRDTDIYGNYIYNTWDNAIESEGGNQNVRIWGNFIKNSYAHIAIATVRTGPIYIWKNVVSYSKYYDECWWSGDQRTQGIFLKTDGVRGQGRVYFFHNTALQPPPNGGSLTTGISHGISGNYVANIITRNNLFILNYPDANGNFIGDLYYPSSNGKYDYDLFNGDIYNSLLPSEVHGIIDEDPIYSETPYYNLNASNEGVFTLASSSPGYDDGVIIPNFNDDYFGTAPDIGAHEAGSFPMKFGKR